ncbi:hypothetical protein MNAN1_003614 [Malassezia nana]|uniref:Chromo shadow domain-containing protein n=1 Tax=Malassezia nana TaxID=180528 RepID=A0AAF0EPV7_9BASI|nr:hypothetical protein MNAN1_003614 [Malassezia nana]
MPPHATTEADEWEEATVKEILAHRYHANSDHLEYLIQWHDNDASWEPEQNSVGAEPLVYDYWTIRQGVDKDTALEYVRSLHGNPAAARALEQDSPAQAPTEAPRPTPAEPPATTHTDASETQTPAPDAPPAAATESSDSSSTAPKAESPYSSIQPGMSEEERAARQKYDNIKDWDPLLVRIETLRRVPAGVEALLEFHDGERLAYPTSLANRRCPQAMIAFYESRVRFIVRGSDAKHDTPSDKAPAAPGP